MKSSLFSVALSILSAFFGILAVCPAAQESHLSEYEKKDQTLPKEELLPSPDRAALRPMEQAKQLIERNRIQDAVQRISAILEGNDDFFLPGDEEENEKNGRLTRRSLKESAETLFLSLSEEGRRLYAIQYEPLARRLLDNAIQAGSLRQIAEIADRYFHTESGREAAFVFAMNQFDRGARGSALLLLRKIAAHAPSPDPYEPNFSLTLAACQSALGEADAAKRTLEDFLRRHPNPRLRDASGTYWTPGTVEEILAQLNPGNGEPDIADWLEHGGWRLSTGTSSQDYRVRASVPLLELLWKLRVLADPKQTGTLHVIEGQMRLGGGVFIPAARPVVLGDTVVYRGNEGLVAVSAKTGKRLWVAREPQYRMPTIGTTLLNRGVPFGAFPNVPNIPGGTVMDTAATLLRMRLWHNHTLGTLTSDGRLVFSIENEPSVEEQGFRRAAVFLRPGQQFEDPRNRISTTLVARDVTNGEIVWKTGKAVLVQKLIDQIERDVREEHEKNRQERQPRRVAARLKAVPPGFSAENAENTEDVENVESTENAEAESSEAELASGEPPIEISDEERFLGDTYFLGPPLPIREKLYVLGEHAGVIRLFVFGADSGRLLRHFGLVEPVDSIETNWLRRFRGPSPAYGEGILVCPTASGAIAAFDLSTEKPLWCYTYSDKPEEPETPPGGIVQVPRIAARGFGMILNQYGMFPFNFSGTNDDFRYLSDYVGWSNPATIIHGGKIVFAPVDRPMLYCFDLLSGALLWKRSKGEGKYVACIHENRVVIVTEHSLVALDLETGMPFWNDAALAPLPPRTPSLPNGLSVRGAVSGRVGNPSGESFPDVLPARSQTLPAVTFEKGATPTGVGLRNGDSYMIPMSDRSVCVVDLNLGKIVETTPSLDGTPLGNLVAVGGKVFSQSATELNCFNQVDSLRAWAREALRENPDDPEAFVQLGRLAFAENDHDEALELFRKAHSLDSNVKTRGVMRRVLVKLFESDFAKYRTSLEDLERLADDPPSLVSILFAYADGCRRVGDDAEFLRALKRLLEIDQHSQGLRELGDSEELLMSRWIGNQVRTLSGNPTLAGILEQLAQGEFDRIVASEPVGESSANRSLSRKRRQWSRFLDCFGTFPIAGKAREELYRLYEREGRDSELEFFFNPISAAPPDDSGSGSEATQSAEPPVRFAGIRDWNSGDRGLQARSILRLAEIMEASRQWYDALHYYRMLGRHYGEQEIDPSDPSRANAEILYREKLNDPNYASLLRTKPWPGGEVEFELQQASPGTSLFSESEATEMAFAGYHPAGQFLEIPLLSGGSPFFRGDRILTSPDAGLSCRIFCLDHAGRKAWSVALPETTQETRPPGGMVLHMGQQVFFANSPGYFKAYNHVLYLVMGRSVVAIDTLSKDSEGEAGVAWTRTLQSYPGPVRLLRGALNVNESLSLGSFTGQMRFSDPIFVNAKVFCVHDLDAIYGLDPLSGELLWKRDSYSFQSFLTGDEKFVYQIRPTETSGGEEGKSYSLSGAVRERLEAVRIDCDTGQELSVRLLPASCLAMYGTKIVYLKHARSNAMQLEIFDLNTDNDVELMRRDLALSTDPKRLDENRLHGADTALVEPIYTSEEFPQNSLVGFFEQGRIMGILSQTRQLNSESRLLLVDLAQARDVRPAIVLPQQPAPGNLSTSQTRTFHQQRNHFQDFYVEIDGDQTLVLLTNQRHPQRAAIARGTGLTVRNVNRNAFVGIPQQQIGLGMVMRYDAQGRPLWDKPVEIEDWFAQPSPFPFPVMVFGAMCFENRANGMPSVAYPVLWGLDKKTGERRFSKRVDFGNDVNRIYNVTVFPFIDPANNRIAFVNDRWTLSGTFREPSGEQPSSPSTKNAPSLSETKFSSKWFQILGEAPSRKDGNDFRGIETWGKRYFGNWW